MEAKEKINLKLQFMKALIIFLMFISMAASGQSYYGRTKHKPIKRMTTREVRESIKGRTLYERHSDGVVRNTRTPWSTVSKPTEYRPYYYDSRDRNVRNKKRKENQLKMIQWNKN